MAKNDNKLSYLQMPLPEGKAYYKITKRSWSGLNYRQKIDSGALSAEKNISTLEAPYLVPAQLRNALAEPQYLSGIIATLSEHTPIVEHVEGPEEYIPVEKHAICMFGFDDFLLVIYRDAIDDAIKVDYIINAGTPYYKIYTGVLKGSGTTSADDYPRCVVQFNVYNTPTDPITSGYTRKLLIFPDKISMDFDFYSNIVEYTNGEMPYIPFVAPTQNTKEFYYNTANQKYYKAVESSGTYAWAEATINDVMGIRNMDVHIEEYEGTAEPPESASHNYYYYNKTTQETYRWVDDEVDKSNSGWKVTTPPSMPGIKYAAVHLSRLFGVDDYRVYASGFNDYTNWNLDTIDEYNESNAWCSPAQSNTKAGGVFTGITNYQGHIVCFKKDFMHEIYNSKNPFRIQDIYAEGAIDNRTIQDVDGKLIFVSDDNVKIYTGSNPRIISYNLNMPEYVNAVSGTDGRCYYLYCEDASGNTKKLFVYDTFVDEWSEQEITLNVLSFAHNKNGMYMLCSDGIIYKMDTNEFSRVDGNIVTKQSWSFETDLITRETVNIKHLKKIQMLADMAAGSVIKVYALYDDEDFSDFDSAKKQNHLVYSYTNGGNACCKTIRVKTRKTANYGVKLHVEGTGYVKLYELEMFIENGGDLYA